MKKSSRSIIIITGLLLATAAITTVSSRWLWASISFDPPPPETAFEELTIVKYDFITRLNSYLEDKRPGDFDALNCQPFKETPDNSQLIALAADLGRVIWQGEDNDRETLDSFLEIQDRASKKTFIQNYRDNLEPGRIIPYNLYEAFLQNYFIEDANEIYATYQFHEAEDPVTSLPLGSQMQGVTDLVNAAGRELSEAQFALEIASEFIIEEWQAATTISGLCRLLEESDNLRRSLKALRKDTLDLIKMSGPHRLPSS